MGYKAWEFSTLCHKSEPSNDRLGGKRCLSNHMTFLRSDIALQKWPVCICGRPQFFLTLTTSICHSPIHLIERPTCSNKCKVLSCWPPCFLLASIPRGAARIQPTAISVLSCCKPPPELIVLHLNIETGMTSRIRIVDRPD